MASPQPQVSVIVPITPALDRVKTVLFRPFDLAKWLIIGFCAWLARLGEGGGNGSGFNVHGDGKDLGRQLGEAKEFVVHNLFWIVPLVVVLIVVGILLWLLFTWLSSRGRFMFLHCVAGNRAEVRVPWTQYGRHGDSLFVFRILLGVISLASIGPLVVGAVLLIGAMVLEGAPSVAGVTGAIGIFLVVVVLGITFALVAKFTSDFVVPVMFLKTPNCWTGWREFLGVVSGHKADFVLYILFQILLKLVIGALVLGIVLATCCLACCLLAIPFIGTVLLLPILVFERSYSLYYLAQFGPDYDVFPPGPPAVPVS